MKQYKPKPRWRSLKYSKILMQNFTIWPLLENLGGWLMWWAASLPHSINYPPPPYTHLVMNCLFQGSKKKNQALLLPLSCQKAQKKTLKYIAMHSGKISIIFEDLLSFFELTPPPQLCASWIRAIGPSPARTSRVSPGCSKTISG